MEILKHIESFLYPVVIEVTKSDIHPYLEIAKYNGKYQLNNKEANLSEGGLLKIFNRIFNEINIQQYNFENILVLGLGGGSVIKLLRKFKIDANITAVEIDPVVINLAKKYFNIQIINNLTIINDDAYDFVRNSSVTYDLIISDVFICGDVPQKFSTIEYLKGLKRISSLKSIIIYNKITEEQKHINEFASLFIKFKNVFESSEVIRININDTENSLLISNTFNLN